MLGKPVLTTGSAIYRARELTQALQTGADLSDALTVARPADSHTVDTLLGHLAQTVLLADGDTRQFALQLKAAKPVLEDYLPHYQLPLQKTVRAASALNVRLRRNQTLAQGFSGLSHEDSDCLSAALSPDVISNRPFGGPIIGDAWAPPVISDRPLELGTVVFPELENLPSPDVEIAALGQRPDGCVFSVRLRPTGDSADIQSFSVESLARLIQPIVSDFQIMTWPGGDHASIYLRRRRRTDTSLQTAISFPAPIFRAGKTAAPIAEGDALPLSATHAHYGPYARLPEGQWSVARLMPPSEGVKGLQDALTILAARKMRLQVLEHVEGGEPLLIHETSWLRPSGVFRTRPDMKYELRSFMPKTKSKANGPRFYGFAISTASGAPINSTSAP